MTRSSNTDPKSRSRLDVRMIRTSEEFRLLEDSWNDLYDASPGCTPFQSWAWLYSWWEHYSEVRELRIIAVSDPDDEQTLVAIFPFMIESRKGFRRLLFIGTGITDFLDILIRDGWREPAISSGAESLEKMGSWWCADLQEIRPDAAVIGLFDAWNRTKSIQSHSPCPRLSLTSWDDLLGSLSKNHRSTVRRTLKRAAEDNLEARLVNPGDTERATRTWIELHRTAWSGREISEVHLDDEFEECMVSAVTRMTERGTGYISEFVRDGKVEVSHLLVIGKDFIGQHLFGATSEALSRYQTSALMVKDISDMAQSRHMNNLSFLRGSESYKLRWTDDIVQNKRIILSKSYLLHKAYEKLLGIRSRKQED